MNWATATLGNFLRIKHGYAFKGAHFAPTGAWLVLTPGNFREQGGLKSQGDKEKFYSVEPPLEFVLKRGDLLIVMTDLTQEARILGSPAFIPEDNHYLHNQRLGKVVDLKTDELDRKYLFYLFNWRVVREQLKASATGTTVRHTAPERICKVRIPLPPISLQRRIASILSTYDDLIENNTRRITVIEEMAHRLFEEWFVKLHSPRGSRRRQDDAWHEGPVSEIAIPVGHALDPAVEPQRPFEHYSFPAFDAGMVPEIVTGSEIKSNKVAFTAPVVLLAKLNPRFPRVWSVVKGSPHPQICSTEFIPLAAIKPWSVPLLEEVLKSASFRERLSGLAGGTSTSHQRVKRADALALKIVVPPKELVHEAHNVLEPLHTLRQTLRDQNGNLRTQRDLLLPKLMSGEIDLSERVTKAEAAE